MFLQTRFCVKYRHCDGALVLKITDDKTVSPLTRHTAINASFKFTCYGWLHTVCQVPDRPATGCEEAGETEQCPNEKHGRKVIGRSLPVLSLSSLFHYHGPCVNFQHPMVFHTWSIVTW